jgi:hypothetical protein
MSLDLPALMNADKMLATKPQWVLVDCLRLKLAVGLDIGGITQEGLELHGSCIQAYPDREV